MNQVALPKKSIPGFTLIELLVVLVVFSLLALMSYRGLSSVLDTRSYVKQETDKWHRVTAFFSRFEQDIHLAAPRPVRTATGISPAWLADSSRPTGPYLEFSRFSSADGLDSAHRIAYTLNERKELELWLWPGLDIAPGALPERHIVLTGVASVEMKYLDASFAWVPAWQPSSEIAALPRGVQVGIVLTSGEQITRVFAL